MANLELQNYITERKATLSERSRPALIMTHVVCGYPSFDDNWKELEIMQEFGVDLVELQFPRVEPAKLLAIAHSARIHSGILGNWGPLT